MPTTKIVVTTSTMSTASRLNNPVTCGRPTSLTPGGKDILSIQKPWYFTSTLPVVVVNAGGNTNPSCCIRLLKYPAQPEATVDAPNAYSSVRSQPMIHATNSPRVAYPYVYADPAI